MPKIWKENFSLQEGTGDYKLFHYLPKGMVENAKHVVGSQSWHEAAFVERNGGVKFFIPNEQIERYIDDIIAKVLAEPEWVRGIHEECRTLNAKLFACARKVEATNLGALSDTELLQQENELARVRTESHMIAQSTTWFIDSDEQKFSRLLIERITRELVEQDSALDPLEVFSTLTSPTEQSMAQSEELEWLRIAFDALADERVRSVLKTAKPNEAFAQLKAEVQVSADRLRTHWRKWKWVPYGYVGPTYSLEHYVNRLAEALQSGEDLLASLKDLEQRNEVMKEKQREILERVQISQELQTLLRIAQEIIWLKDYRKMCYYYAMYALDLLHQEAAKRLKLALVQVNHMTPEEFAEALQKKSVDTDLLNERRKFSVIHYDGSREHILIGSAAQQFLDSMTIEQLTVEPSGVLKGMCACPGKARAVVKIINHPSEMEKMETGNIMVSHTTFPSLVPAMRKAAAIITEDGGITCHAAIVSREFHIPCVVGVKAATAVLKDGDTVEVDARAGVIRKI